MHYWKRGLDEQDLHRTQQEGSILMANRELTCKSCGIKVVFTTAE